MLESRFREWNDLCKHTTTAIKQWLDDINLQERRIKEAQEKLCHACAVELIVDLIGTPGTYTTVCPEITPLFALKYCLPSTNVRIGIGLPGHIAGGGMHPYMHHAHHQAHAHAAAQDHVNKFQAPDINLPDMLNVPEQQWATMDDSKKKS